MNIYKFVIKSLMKIELIVATAVFALILAPGCSDSSQTSDTANQINTPTGKADDSNASTTEPFAPLLPSYNVAYASTGIALDGIVDSQEWAGAQIINFQFPWPQEGVKNEATTARLMWDKENLYVSYECEDEYIKSLITTPKGDVYTDDCVEIFVSPDREDVSRYVAFEMNAQGVLLDYVTSEAGQGQTKQFDYEWLSSGVEIKTSLFGKSTYNDDSDIDTGWSLEIKIPLSNFASQQKNPIEQQPVWRANLNRTSGGQKGVYSTWSSTKTPKPAFHHSAFFGSLAFQLPPE